MKDRPTLTLEAARQAFIDKRVFVATYAGILAFVLEAIEPWLNFRDPTTIEIQLGTAFIVLCSTLVFWTRWGARHKLLIFNLGFLFLAAGFETVVCHEKAFDTPFSDAFDVLFAFYTVLIPVSVVRTGLIGIALGGILSLPSSLITRNFSGIGTDLLGDLSGFGILLYGRYLANKLWESDFTSRQTSESYYRQLVQSEKMAALGRLAAGLAHELNNPLAVVASSARSIERCARQLFDDQLPTKQEVGATFYRAIERLRLGTERMSSVNDLLRQYVSPPLREMVPSDVSRQIDVALSLLESKVGAKAISIHRTDGCNMLLLCDPQILSHVFVNLLDNACDAVGEHGNIWISSEIKADGQLELSVRDDGPGIDESMQSRVGEPFVTTKEPGKGLGLGLALSRLIVEKHAGKLDVSNRMPGTEAKIIFPPDSLFPRNSSIETILRGSNPNEQPLP